MSELLSIAAFLKRAKGETVVDVRTPAEFAKGHIPGAVNLPLFSDAERAEIGTLYVQEGRRDAILRGLALTGPRMEAMAERLLALASESRDGLLLHCWRGGMRSSSVAWLAELLGIPVATLKGGYKAFRRFVFDSFSLPRLVRVIGGYTGVGKTAVLAELAKRGESVIDLEALAAHKGSAFGDLGESSQPTQEQFENDLALAWSESDPDRPLWLEDESRSTGQCILPASVWQCKQAGVFEVIRLADAERIHRLCEMYAHFPIPDLMERVERIRRRLGGARTESALAALRVGNTVEACREVLYYYDRAYQKSIDAIPSERRRIHEFDTLDPAHIADVLLSHPFTTNLS